MAIRLPAQRRKANWSEVAEATDPAVVRAAVARETETWGEGLLALGALQLVGGRFGLDPLWGVALILTAVASFFCQSGAMLPVYGVMVGWAMIMNLFSGELVWTGVGLLQVYWTFCIFRDFRSLRRTTARLQMNLASNEGQTDRAAGLFPYAGCALTAVAWLAVAVGFVGLVAWFAVSEQMPSDGALDTGIMAIMDLACLGLAVSVAAVLARYRLRALSLIGASGSGLLLIAFIALALLGG